MERRRLDLLFAVVLLHGSLAHAGETKQDKIRRALSAAPPTVARAAKVVDMDNQGKTTVLREGTNGFTCFPGHPGVVGDVAMCADAPSMQWVMDFMAHKPRPTNTQPGVNLHAGRRHRLERHRSLRHHRDAHQGAAPLDDHVAL